MDGRLQKRVQRYGWDRAAPFYEKGWRDQLQPAQDLLLQRAGLSPGEKVLDVAAGTGLISFPAAEAVTDSGLVVATDISDAMVDVLAKEAARRGLSHITAKQEEAEAISFPDETFDAALCALGLMYVPDPKASVNEMARVVRKGGRVVAAVWGSRSACGWAGIFSVVDARVATDVCPLFFALGTGDTLSMVFQDAGLEVSSSDRIQTTMSYASPEDACLAAFAGGPVAMAYSRFDDQEKTEAHAEYLASIETFRSDSGYAIPGEFVIVAGRRPS